MPTNDFLPFCPTDTGTNLLSESDYLAATGRTIGNQPGVASAKLVNKALRQSTYMAAELAAFLAQQTGADILDDATPAKLLAQINASIRPLNPVINKYLTGSGNHNLTYKFMIVAPSVAPTAGATYTNNGITYTCVKTVTGLEFQASGSGAPTVSGTLTKTAGTGDAALTFYAVRAPLYIRVKALGAGGGGAGGGAGPGAGGNGGDTTFGVMTAGGGVGGSISGSSAGGAGGTPTLGVGPIGTAMHGGQGGGNYTSPGGTNSWVPGGVGGASALAGGTSNGPANANGPSAGANTGAGGGGSCSSTNGGQVSGCGGGAGAYIDAIITSPSGQYAYGIGAGGLAGTAGTFAGGTGGSGYIEVEEHYQ